MKLPDKIAISVDAQMDDGKGRTGSVRANRATYQQNNGKGKGSGGGNPTAVKEVADEYTEDGVTTYVVCRQILL
ncbi:MAG TPA: hypothetical protein VFT23_17160 [Burkholderiales bacterium]|nr:hypothetical protein [Burkholderiales bacterium]